MRAVKDNVFKTERNTNLRACDPNGADVSSPRFRPQWEELTIRRAGSEWLASILPRVKATTYAKYRMALSNYICPLIGDELIAAFSNRLLQDFANQLLCCGGKKCAPLSPKTVTDTLAILREVIGFGADRYGLMQPVLKKVSVHRRAPRIRVLSQEERLRLTEYLLRAQTFRDGGILLALYTGIRIGELCALTWKNIDLAAETLQVESTLTRVPGGPDDQTRTALIVSTPKSACSVRQIPLPHFLAQAIMPMQQADACVFLSGMPGVYIEPRNMQYYFARTLKTVGIPHANFHALRHTFATECVTRGFDLKSLSEILGHASVNITMNKYVHPSMEQKRRNMNKFQP